MEADKKITGQVRCIVGDVETTGLSFHEGHRIVEIGLIETIDGKPTGRIFHKYVDPLRDVPEKAFEVHKLTREECILRGGGQTFADVAQEMIEFIAGDTFIAHNAPFDVGFLGDELKAIGLPTLIEQGCSVICTLAMAQVKYGQGCSLDVLNRRLLGDAKIEREAHGALLDSYILANVYQVMTIEQSRMEFDTRIKLSGPTISPARIEVAPGALKRTVISAKDSERHQQLCTRIRKASGGVCIADSLDM